MSKKSYDFPFHIGDFLGGVISMDAAEVGAYTMLFVAHYQAGLDGLENDETKLARIAKCTPKVWQRVRSTVLAKFYLEGDRWKHAKVIEVLNLKGITSANQRANSLERWNRHDADGMRSDENKSASEKPSLTNSDFEAKPLNGNGRGHAAGIPTFSPRERDRISPLTPLRENLTSGKRDFKNFSEERSEKDDSGADAAKPFRIDLLLKDADLRQLGAVAPQWDKYVLQREYDDRVNSGRFARPRYPATAFLAWAASYTKGKPP